MLDVFKGDAFSTISLTTAINKLPYVPGRIGAMGLFVRKPITTTTAAVEERNGRIQLVPTSARGTGVTTGGNAAARHLRTLLVPHVQINDEVLADSVQGVRAFGSEDSVESVADVVNEKMQTGRQSIEVTQEYHRVRALHGKLLDADGTTVLYDLFDEFDVTEQTVDFNFGTDDIKIVCLELIRLMESQLGGTPFDHVHAICGNNFWDALIADESVKGAYEKWQVGTNGLPFTISQQRSGFPFGEVVFENYRGSVGDVAFVDTDTARFFPAGAPGLFQEVNAPADYIETVNTPGKPIYAKQEEMKFGKGIELEMQSNFLMLPTRPGVLIKGTKS